MPFMARVIAHHAPVRPGATLREVDALADLIRELEAGDTPLDFIIESGRRIASAHPEARLEVAIHTEAGSDGLIEVADGELVQHHFELENPVTGFEVDADVDGFAEIEVRGSAPALEAWARRQTGEDLLEATSESFVEIVFDCPIGATECANVLGVVARRMVATEPESSLLLLDDGYFLAELDRERGCRLHPIQRSGDERAVRRFQELTGSTTPAPTDWTLPPVPESLRD